MKFRRIKCLLIALVAGISFSAPGQDIRNENWIQDINYLETELPRRHVSLFTVKSQQIFRKELQELKLQLPQMPDVDIALRLQQIIAGFGDSHTNIDWRSVIDSTELLPLQLYWFNDGIYILKTLTEYEPALGKKIIRINNFPITDIVDSLKTLITDDNRASVKNSIPRLIPYLSVLKYFHICDSSYAEITLADTSGSVVRMAMNSPGTGKKFTSIQPYNTPFFLQYQKKLFTAKYFPQDSIYYILYNKCWSRELEQQFPQLKTKDSLPSFTEFQKSVLETIDQYPIRKLIFDMRLNSGGSSLQGTNLVNQLAAIRKIREDNIIYVIIGRNTFSSAIINVLDFRQKTRAVLVGEGTEGKPSHYGEVRSFRLPKSGIAVSYSTKYFERNMGYTDTIEPDVLIESSITDFKRGIDPVFEWIRRQP